MDLFILIFITFYFNFKKSPPEAFATYPQKNLDFIIVMEYSKNEEVGKCADSHDRLFYYF